MLHNFTNILSLIIVSLMQVHGSYEMLYYSFYSNDPCGLVFWSNLLVLSTLITWTNKPSSKAKSLILSSLCIHMIIMKIEKNQIGFLQRTVKTIHLTKNGLSQRKILQVIKWAQKTFVIWLLFMVYR